MLATEFRRILAPVLRECPQACGMVAITNIDVADDLTSIVVHISALKEPEAAHAYLSSKTSELRGLIGRLQTHRTPQIFFRIDRSAEEGSRVERLIQQSMAERRDETDER
jgi:ribosome-binding factor A